METALVVSKPKPHVAQKEVLANAERFNVLDIGRRWGKSKLAIKLAMETMIDGGSVGYFVPTYFFADDFWDEIKERLEPIIEWKSESKRRIRLITGGVLEVWSLEKKRAGRSRKYKRVIIDEAAFGKDLKESWEKAIRPTLTDLQGDAWILSTPQGMNNYFFKLFENDKRFANWKSFQMPSSTNPYLSKDELDEIKSQLDELTWLQEFEAQFVDFTGRPFAYSFRPKDVGEKKSHLAKLGKPTIALPLYLSFDFNVDPITCIVAQHPNDRSWVKVYREFRLKDSNIYKLCDAIYSTYGDDYFIKVTGDASGGNRSAMVDNNLNYYKIIMDKLGLPIERFSVPNANPSIGDNRVLCNSLLERHPNYLIDPDGCPFLVEDLKYCEVNDKGEIDTKKDKHKGHLLDAWRYYNEEYHGDFIKKYRRGKK